MKLFAECIEEKSFSAITEDALHVYIVDHPFRPVSPNANEPLTDPADQADIRVIGIGPMGTNMVQILSRNLPGIRCHEILRSMDGDDSNNISSLLFSVAASDLAFVITAFEDEYCTATAQVVGAAAVGAGVPTLLVTDGRMQDMSVLNREVPKWFDTVFRVSRSSFPDLGGSVPLSPESLIGFGMRHVVGTTSHLINYRSGVCIDLSDVASIFRSGSKGRMGTGVSSNESRGASAASRAIERLETQGGELSSANGILAAVHGSSLITMQDYNAASKVIHDHASADADLLIGLIVDETMGANVKVTLLTVQEDQKADQSVLLYPPSKSSIAPWQ